MTSDCFHMKRLVWLLLAVFVTALAQVAPADMGSQSEKPCSCCETPGQCGERDCGLPPSSSASTTLLAEQPALSQSAATRKKIARVYRLAINYLFQPRALSPVRNSRVTVLASVQPVPLFKAQCSFLI